MPTFQNRLTRYVHKEPYVRYKHFSYQIVSFNDRPATQSRLM